MQAHAPEHVVPGGLPTEAAIAHVIVSNVLPSARDLCAPGIRLTGDTGQLVRPRLLPSSAHRGTHAPPGEADRLFMDETTAPALDPRRGQTKKGYFWAIVFFGGGIRIAGQGARQIDLKAGRRSRYRLAGRGLV